MMRLLRLQITGFGALHDCTVDFSPTLTVLVGPNEAGKSTLLACIAQVLMGKPSQRSLFPDYTPWDGGVCAAALEFTQHEQHYRLTRRFDESGPRAVALHQLHDEGTERLLTQEAAEVRKWLQAAFGTADDRIFYRVFCLSQADLNPLDNFGGLREHLERSISGAEVAVTAAMQRLDERLAALRRGVGQPALVQNWGAVKRAEEARREAESRLREATNRQQNLQRTRESLLQIRDQIAEGTTRLSTVAGVLEEDRRRRELLTRLAELRSAWSNLENQRERTDHLLSERTRLQGLLTTLPPLFTDPDAVRDRVTAAERHESNPSERWGWSLVGVGVCFTLLLLVGVSTGLSRQWLFTLPILLAPVVIGASVLARAAQQARKFEALCAELGVESLAEAHQRLEAAERYRRDLDVTSRTLEAVSNSDDDTERRHTLAREIAVTEAALAQIPGTPLAAEDAHRLSNEHDDMQRRLPDLRQREMTLAQEFAVLDAADRDLIDLEDSAAFWHAEEARAREEEQTLLLARELLSQAGQQAHHALSAPLAARITPLFAAMTGDRYPRVRVEGDAKALRIVPLDVAGHEISPDQLSRGTRDQFILAVRLALGQALALPDGAPVFLLDDPLLHFDADRRREAVAMLGQLAAEMQIVVATHDEHLAAELRGSAVRLPQPAGKPLTVS